jgi:hypothetical protein
MINEKNNIPWKDNPLRGNESVPLETLRSWLPKNRNHPEYEKIECMIKFKEKQINVRRGVWER